MHCERPLWIELALWTMDDLADLGVNSLANASATADTGEA